MKTFFKTERTFLISWLAAFCLSMIVFPYPQIAMWVGFVFAAYATIANDSIQTIGTFLGSNKHRQWYYLWAFLSAIFLLTVGYSWYYYSGDVTHQRLLSKGFETAPSSFSVLHLAAPLVLLLLTRLRMPVSTTFLILSSFATTAAIGKVLFKSLSGYFLSFTLAFFFFLIVVAFVKKYFNTKAHPGWNVAQWLTSGLLWSVWIMQDAANIAVYLPRSLSLFEFLTFCAVIVIGLGILVYRRGGKIQRVVTEKTDIIDVRAATFVDLLYAVILFYFKLHSQIPMSTTWVFIGLLAGRELAITTTKYLISDTFSYLKTFKLIGKDVGFALIGLSISIIIAVAANDGITYSDISTQFLEQGHKFVDKLF